MDSPIPTLSHMAHLVHEKLIWYLQGPIYPIGLGPSYLCLFSEHNIFTLKSVLFWMKKLCGHSTISTTSGCGEYLTQPSFLRSSLLCHLANLLDSQAEIRVHSASELQESHWRPFSRLERKGRCLPLPMGGTVYEHCLPSGANPCDVGPVTSFSYFLFDKFCMAQIH